MNTVGAALYNSQQNRNSSKGSENFMKFVMSPYLPLVIIGVLLFYVIFLLHNPPELSGVREFNSRLEKVGDLVTLPQGQTPLVAQITDVESLKSENAYQAEIYANAMDGDFVYGYGERMIIYRESTDQIIYDGLGPVAKIEEEIVSSLVSAANSAGLDIEASDPVQLSVVNDPAQLQSAQGAFYTNAQAGDIIAIYPEVQLILLYRPSSSSLVNSGNLSISIN